MPEWLGNDAAFDAAVKPLWDFLRVGDKPEPCDAIFLFGGPYPDAASRAAEIFQAGYAPFIVVTGNRGTGSGHFEGNSEAEYFGRLIAERGVDPAVILLEAAATNTGENVEFGMKTLLRHVPNPRQLVIIASPGHLRRCVATFKKQFPSIVTLACPPAGLPSYFAQYYSRRRVAERLLEEMQRLRTYPERGFIVPVAIPNDVRLAEEALRHDLLSV